MQAGFLKEFMIIPIKGYLEVPDGCDSEAIENAFTVLNSELTHMGLKGQINELGNPKNRPLQVRQ